MTQRNNLKRVGMLAHCRSRQEWREYGRWAGGHFYPFGRPKLIPASINRRTGKPHLHERAKARAMKQWSAA